MWGCRQPECNCEGHRNRYLARDQSAARSLVQTLTPMVDAVVQKKLPKAGSEERVDVRQDAFLRMFRDLKDWKGECDFCFWVRRIAIRAAFDQARRNKRLEQFGKAPDDPDKIVDWPACVTIQRMVTSRKDAWFLRHQARRAVEPFGRRRFQGSADTVFLRWFLD